MWTSLFDFLKFEYLKPMTISCSDMIKKPGRIYRFVQVSDYALIQPALPIK
jgi:hypothetical protein